MAEPADINVDELRRRARRRLVGAVVLALGVAVVVPMLLETEQKPLGEDISVRIPPIDDSKFVNRISESRAKDGASPSASPSAEPGKDTAPAAAPAAPKYDTRIAEPPTVAPPAAANTGPSDGGAPTSPKAGDAKSTAGAKGSGAAEPSKPTTAIAAAPRADVKPPLASVAPPDAAASNAKAPLPHEGFAVQLAAFADDKGANALASRLKKGGYAAYTEPLKTSKGTLWRVRVGPYPSREAAAAARDKLKTEGQSGIVAAVK